MANKKKPAGKKGGYKKATFQLDAWSDDPSPEAQEWMNRGSSSGVASNDSAKWTYINAWKRTGGTGR